VLRGRFHKEYVAVSRERVELLERQVNDANKKFVNAEAQLAELRHQIGDNRTPDTAPTTANPTAQTRRTAVSDKSGAGVLLARRLST
jgi:hypothetical protein